MPASYPDGWVWQIVFIPLAYACATDRLGMETGMEHFREGVRVSRVIYIYDLAS